MGFYLNNKSKVSLYKSEMQRPYFVDKTLILFEKDEDTKEIFDQLKISKSPEYEKHRNKHDVIYIDFSKMPEDCDNYDQYISRIINRLKKDLIREYPDADYEEEDALWDILDCIFDMYDGQKFIFVMDEWDCVFHKAFITREDQQKYISFLSNLLKDHGYVELSYMTGILPIAKYSSGSELNMFLEYTMASEEKFNEYFGFTESEVDDLFQKYLEICETPMITREQLRLWYDGYATKAGERMYNPRSVVTALSNNNIGNYWTSSGPYDEIFYYIKNNVADVKADLALMVSGEAVQAKVREYAAASMNLSTKNEIFSAMVVYGFLSYENGRVRIPNKELMNKCEKLMEYSQLIAMIRKNYDELEKKYAEMKIQKSKKEIFAEAVSLAIEEAIRNNILKETLRNNKAEVTDMLLTEFDEKDYIEGVKEESERRGEMLNKITLIIKKVKKAKPLPTIAAELEEEEEEIKPIYKAVVASAPDYNIEEIKTKLNM